MMWNASRGEHDWTKQKACAQMLKSIYYSSHHHNLWLVGLALLVSIFAAATAALLMATASRARKRTRLTLFLVSGVCGGAGVWVTHFIGMLAFDPGVATAFDLVGTAGSLVISVAGGALAVLLTIAVPKRWSDLTWGLSFGLSAGAMHYAGMAALRLPGHLSWSPTLVMMSLMAGIGFSMCARIAVRRLKSALGFIVSTGLIVIATCGLHLLGMAALVITPDARIEVPANILSHGALALGVGTTAGLVGLVCLVCIWIESQNRRSTIKELAALVEALPQAAAYFDEKDEYVLGNSAFGREIMHMGLSPQAGLRYRSILDGVDAKDQSSDLATGDPAWIIEHLDARRLGKSVLDHELADGRVLRVETNLTSTGGSVTVLSDITDLKRHAADLAAARDLAEAADQAKGKFLSIMSHELRTPLNGVLGVAELLAKEPLAPGQLELVAMIQDSSAALDRLLGDLLNVAAGNAGSREIRESTFNLPAVVGAVMSQFADVASRKGVALNLSVSAEAEAWIRFDEAHFRQALGHLISNAVKFTDSGRVDVDVTTLADTVVFTIADTGIGFDPELRERLFQRFEQLDGSNTRRFGGTGLGLSVARDLARGMGGDLACDSRPGEGSTFVLTLPFRREGGPLEVQAPTTDEHPDTGGALQVLVVDDNPVNQRVLSLILGGAGVETVLADNGQQAVERWRAGHFDAILMDIQMPVMDGLTAVRTIRTIEADDKLAPTPIIMVSANALPEHVAASFSAGANSHVAKPVTAERLFAALGDLSDGPGTLPIAHAA